MAQEALGLAVYDKLERPIASAPQKVNVDENDFVVMITLDLSEYRKNQLFSNIN